MCTLAIPRLTGGYVSLSNIDVQIKISTTTTIYGNQSTAAITTQLTLA
jgi:hypothetical protein